MNLIEFPEQVVVVAKDQPEYAPMPAYLHPNGTVVCCWKLTARERFKLLFSGVIWHSMLAFGQPLQPQLLEVDKPPMPSRRAGVTARQSTIGPTGGMQPHARTDIRGTSPRGQV